MQTDFQKPKIAGAVSSTRWLDGFHTFMIRQAAGCLESRETAKGRALTRKGGVEYPTSKLSRGACPQAQESSGRKPSGLSGGWRYTPPPYRRPSRLINALKRIASVLRFVPTEAVRLSAPAKAPTPVPGYVVQVASFSNSSNASDEPQPQITKSEQ